ncbi:MAG: aspartate aminotransferase, partial [Saprospiraceae bacterium]
EPFYANYIGFTNFCAAEVVPITSYLDTAFSLPAIDSFKAKLTDRTKAIVLCNPGNPTGKVYPKKDLEAIIDFVVQNDLFLIVDEVYKEFCYDHDFYSVLQFEKAREHVIVIDSVSKIFSLCGARVGFLATANKAIQDSVLKFAQMRLCPPYHGQILAEAAFKNSYPYLEEVKAEYRIRRNTLNVALQKIDDIKIYLPEGAFYIIAELPVADTDAFCQWMLSDFSYKNKTVMFSPASGFYFNTDLGKNQIRIAFILNSQDIREAIECLSEGLKVYNDARIVAKQMST